MNILITITPEEYEALQEVRPIYQEDTEPYKRTEDHILNIVRKFEDVIEKKTKPLNAEVLAKDLARKIEHFRCLGMVAISAKYSDRVKQTEQYELAGHEVSEARRLLAEARKG